MLRSSASDDTINTISTTLLLAACSAPQAAEPQQTPFRQILGQSSFHTSSQRLIFHAVLRGLYEDGVRDDVIARLTRTDAATGMPYSFVYACPCACLPSTPCASTPPDQRSMETRWVPRPSVQACPGN